MVLGLILAGATAFAGPLIINGEDATVDDYPMTGVLLIRANFQYQGHEVPFSSMLCSSTLIAPDVVLLAAHCLLDEALTGGYGTIADKELRWTRQADLTEWDGTTSSPAWPADSVIVRASVSNDDFDLYGLGLHLSENHDVALLFLDEAMTGLPVAYLPTKEDALQIEEGLAVEVVGWGQQQATSGWDPPAPGTFAIKEMGQSFIAELAPYEMQIGLEESDVRKCHGDSGGPTFLDIETTTDDSMRLIGVTSHTYDNTDCDSKGGVDTRVDFYLDWIDAQMRAACADGTRAWCDEPGILLAPTTIPEDSGDGAHASNDGEEGAGKGCGCGTTGGGSAYLAILASLVAFRRRRGNPQAA